MPHGWRIRHSREVAGTPEMFRFSTLQEAADALAAINADYERHSRAARKSLRPILTPDRS
jgi:hypothetical protein